MAGVNLLKDNVRKVFIHYLIPSMGSALVMSIYFLVDFFVVGHGVGADGLAAFSILTPMIALQYCIGQLIGVGASVMYSTRLGEGREREGHAYFTLGLLVIVVCAVVCWIVYALFHAPILTLLGASETTYPYAWDYMFWYTIFCPLAVTAYFWNAFARNDKDPVRAMAGTLSGGGLNIVLDFLFVFGFGMGITGAALASVLGVCLNVAIVASHFWSKKNTLRIVRPTQPGKKLPQILGSGFPSAMVELSNVFVIFFFNIQLLNYSTELAVSVYGIICNWGILFLSLFDGISLAMQPVCSVNFGAGQMRRVHQTRNLALLIAAIFAAAFFAFGMIATRPVITIFMTGTAEVFAISDTAVRIYFIAFLFMGFTLVLTGYFQSRLWMKRASICAFCRSTVFASVFVFILPRAFGIAGVWASFPAGEAAALALTLLILIVSRKKAKKTGLSH